MARAETDSTIEYGLIGVGEGSVQNMGDGGGGGGGGGYDSQAELDSLWAVSSVSVVIILFIEF